MEGKSPAQKMTKGFYREKRRSNASSVLCTLFLFSVAMFTLPIASYFATIRIMDKYFDIPQTESYIYAVVVAVVVVHLIIIAYVYIAWHEDDGVNDDKDKPSKQE